MVLALQPSCLVHTHTHIHAHMHACAHRTLILSKNYHLSVPAASVPCCAQLTEWAVLIQPANMKWQLLVIG